MCGISGYSGTTAVAALGKSVDALAHRGPDDSGLYTDDEAGVGLGHRRLSILDLSELGHQPMSDDSGAVTLVYNGEIYNFRELRRELQQHGVVFRGRSDTEVLLALYLKFGAECLTRLNGIYAFAIWDKRDGSLFVARDPFGVKPLYYSTTGGAFSFASEIKALLCYPWITRSIDPQAIAHYLRYLWCPAPRTPLNEVQKVRPGEALIVRNGQIARRWQHYEWPSAAIDESRSAQDWANAVRESLDTAVQRQLVSDVPLGAFLSGGLDSSAIVASARVHSATRLQCFTIDFDDKMARREGVVRDLAYARQVAKHLDVDLHVVNVGPDMADDLLYMVSQLDEPQADFAALHVWSISRLARENGIKVLLSGAGGDDLFSGYRRHRALALEKLWDRTPGSVRGMLAGLGRSLPQRPALLRRAARLLQVAGYDKDRRVTGYFDWAPPDLVKSLFKPELTSSLHEEPLIDALNALPDSATPLQRMLRLEQQFFLCDHNLNYTDKMSMAAGVEVRVPFLDPDLVTLAAQIPDRYRQRGATGKWILKQAMRDVLPADVINRPKTGFGVPLRAWLAGPLQTLMQDLLSTETLRRRGLFEPDAVQRLIADNASGRGDYAYSLLALMCVELWQQRFIDQQDA